MKAKELINYLQTFEPDAKIGIMVANPPGRMRHIVDGFYCLTDAGIPLFGIEVGDGIPFDKEEKKAAEEDENDF